MASIETYSLDAFRDVNGQFAVHVAQNSFLCYLEDTRAVDMVASSVEARLQKVHILISAAAEIRC